MAHPPRGFDRRSTDQKLISHLSQEHANKVSPERTDLCRMRHALMPTTLNERTILPKGARSMQNFDTQNAQAPI
jgi:hypothetical protein